MRVGDGVCALLKGLRIAERRVEGGAVHGAVSSGSCGGERADLGDLGVPVVDGGRLPISRREMSEVKMSAPCPEPAENTNTGWCGGGAT